MTNPVEKYLHEISIIHRSGAATGELPYYGALAELLNAVGRELKPKIRCIVNLSNRGAGHPDLGLFEPQQFQRAVDKEPFPGPKPARGAIEVKGPKDDIAAIAKSEQVARYAATYGTVLVTNLRAFLLVAYDTKSNQAVTLEGISLAESADEFWRETAHPRKTAHAVGERLWEFLRRAMLHGAQLTQPVDVAWFLASYAREARVRVEAADLPALDAIRNALESSLGIQFSEDKGEHFFRSTLVQTLFYGVFSAWVLWAKENPPSSDEKFDWRHASWTLRVPMITELFEQLAIPSRLQPLGLVEVLNWTSAALNRVDRAAFFERFQEEHAVQYFYEPFLQAFDPELRKELGVWYTPPEIVRYMVARVDQALREDLGIEDGLANPAVHVLDPCCGTGAYLVEVLDHIAATVRENSGGDALAMFEVRNAAKNRIYGFELLPAPFVVSHLQLGLVLQRHGVPLADNDRVGVYLTNALTGWKPPDAIKSRIADPEMQIEYETEQLVSSALPQLAEEKKKSTTIKRQSPILVILGNPPYNGYAGVAKMEEERDIAEAYRTTINAPAPQGQGLNDLYVRFFRMAERKIVDETGKGIVCFISNYSWLDGLSFTGMRERYLNVFDRIRIDNLHGDRIISEYAPDGRTSETVFAMRGLSVGIKVGTAISTLIRTGNTKSAQKIEYRDFDQARADERRRVLLESASKPDSQFAQVKPIVEIGLPFKPRAIADDYLAWPQLLHLFPTSFAGIKTARDSFLVDIDQAPLKARIQRYFNSSNSDDEMRTLSPCSMEDTQRFKAIAVRRYLQKRGLKQDNFVPYLYRPLDQRWLYWEPETKLLDEKRSDYVPHIFADNIFMTSYQRVRKGYEPPVVSRQAGSFHISESGTSLIPLYIRACVMQFGASDTQCSQLDLLQPSANQLSLLAAKKEDKAANLSKSAEKYLKKLKATPEDLFFHTIAILHAPAYRTENAGALRQDWPRVPLPSTAKILRASAKLGHQLAALLDPEKDVDGVTAGKIRKELRPLGVFSVREGHIIDEESDFAINAQWGYAGRGGITMPAKGRVREHENAVPEEMTAALGSKSYDICLNDNAWWANVPENVWKYTLGGYQVIKKWLSYREEALLGRALRLDEVQYVTAMIRRISAILMLGEELDANYQAVKAETAGLEAESL